MAALLAAFSACRDGGGDSRIRAYGSVEAREIDVASRAGGRVTEVLVDEDDAVKRGQPLVRFDLSEMEAQRAQALAALAAAQARLRLLQRGAQDEDVTAATKALQAAEIRTDSAKRELARAQALAAQQVIAPKTLDEARTGVQLAESELATRKAQLEKLTGGARREEIAAAAAAVDQAKAALAGVEDRLTDRELVAPVDGVVVHRLAATGEVARRAAPVLVLGELSRPYLDVYVPEGRLGEARRGAQVEVRVDAWPGKVFRGTVAHVASSAEFTP
jgi:HlyD family secretion protein